MRLKGTVAPRCGSSGLQPRCRSGTFSEPREVAGLALFRASDASACARCRLIGVEGSKGTFPGFEVHAQAD
jgi:hypothetical protein